MSSKQNFQWKEMTMGTDYYPEHWDKSLWREDLKRMLEAGITVIRIAEFAWSKVEPEEGVFEYGFFDEFLDLCQEEGMKVIFGTPTATPPVWLTEKYPEVLNSDRNGVKYRHGGRRHYNYNSEIYRQLCSRIVEKEAAHYGKHPAIVGWQIDNELNCEVDEFYSEADTLAFREFLRQKYGTIEALNEAWGTVFWNQTYNSFDQIYVMRPLLNSGNNPHQHLDYIRFISESANSFCRMQADIIRRYKKEKDYITTNGLFGNLDNHRMEKEALDVYTYDSYPNFAFGIENVIDPSALNDRKWTLNLAEVRSVCPHFGIMEQQSGGGGWTTRMLMPAPRPGQLTLWAVTSVAQGADYVGFFRWRTCSFGTEIYWHGILDYDNRDNRKLAEVKDFYSKLKKLDPVCGAEFAAPFALVKDYDNTWDGSVDVWHGTMLKKSEKAIFEAAQRTHTPMDILNLSDETEIDELKKYPVLFYPHASIMTEKRAGLLKKYVEDGGKLVLGARTAFKDIHGHCVMMPQPGLLQPLTGTDIHDFTLTSPAEPEVTVTLGGAAVPMPYFNDVITPLEGTKVLAYYDNSYYAGSAGVTEKMTGKGKTIHVGAAFSTEMAEAILKYLEIIEPFADVVSVEGNIDVAERTKDGHTYLFIMNYAWTEGSYELKKAARNMYTDETESGKLTLPAFGTVVYEI